MYNLIDYSGIFLKRSESLYKHYRDGPASNDTGAILIFPLIIVIVFRLNLKKVYQVKHVSMA